MNKLLLMLCVTAGIVSYGTKATELEAMTSDELKFYCEQMETEIVLDTAQMDYYLALEEVAEKQGYPDMYIIALGYMADSMELSLRAKGAVYEWLECGLTIELYNRQEVNYGGISD